MSAFNQPIGGNDLARFAGPGTFMRLPQVETAAGLDVAVMGVPMDIGTSWRSGTRFGPKQIRAESAMIRPYNIQTGAAPFEKLQVADIGDVAINTFDLADTISIIERWTDAVLSHGAIPLTLGGDHTLTLPILRAVAKHHGPVALVHVDAHADVNDVMFGVRECHGTVFRRAYAENLILPDKVWQIGLRGTGYGPDDFNTPQDWGFNLITAPEIWHRSLAPRSPSPTSSRRRPARPARLAVGCPKPEVLSHPSAPLVQRASIRTKTAAPDAVRASTTTRAQA